MAEAEGQLASAEQAVTGWGVHSDTVTGLTFRWIPVLLPQLGGLGKVPKPQAPRP